MSDYSKTLPAAARAVLTACLRDPGRIYQPLVLTGVASGEALSAAVAEVADSLGVKTFRRFGELSLRAPGEAAVLVVPAAGEGAPRILGEGAGPPDCQIIVWAPSGDATEAADQWGAQALGVRVGRSAAEVSRFAVLADTLQGALRRPGRMYNPLIAVAEPAALDTLGDEANLRMEMAGLLPVVDLRRPFGASPLASAGRLGHRSAVIVRMAGHRPGAEDDFAIYTAIESAINAAAQVVIFADPATADALQAEPGWAKTLGRGMTVRVEPEQTTRAQFAPAAAAPDQEGWPPVDAVLASRPPQLAAAVMSFRGSFAEVAPGDLLQMLSMSQQVGRLVVWTNGRVAFIDVSSGTIVHVSSPTERWHGVLDAAKARGIPLDHPDHLRVLRHRMIEDRACTVATWVDAQFAFMRRTPEPPLEESVSLSAESLAMEFARRADEARGPLSRVAELDRVWRRTDKQPGDAAAPAARALWIRTDGAQAARKVIDGLCLTLSEALPALNALEREGVLVDTGLRRPEPAPAPAEALVAARALWSEGLLEAARLQIEYARAGGGVDPQIAALHAWLLVEARQYAEAVPAFSEASATSEREDAVAAALNALVLTVRLGQATPADAYASAEGQGFVAAALGDSVNTIGDAAIGCAELAIRAGENATAERLLDAAPAVPARDVLRERLARSC